MMKRLFKRLLAVVLCLALTAAIVPATAFAEGNGFTPLEDQWYKYYENTAFHPGELKLYLKGIFIGDITELFPEIDIEEYELTGRYPATDTEIVPPKNYGKQRTVYRVKLREKTREAVLEAMTILNDNQYLFAARPVLGGITPGRVIVTLKEQYYTYEGPGGDPYPDLRDILPEIEIESYGDSVLSIITAQGEVPKEEVKPDYLSRVGIKFAVSLKEKTEEASVGAAESLKNNPYVESAHTSASAVWAGEPSVSFEYSVSDALRVLRVAAKLAEPTPEIASAFYDKDGDGKVTVADALIVLRIAAKLA